MGLMMVVGVACGDDSSPADTTASSSGTAAETTGDPAQTGTTTDEPATDSGPGTETGADSTGTGMADSSGTGMETGTETEGLDCDNLPPGPFTPTAVFESTVFNGSEDITFDGQGNLAGKSGSNIIVVDADGTELESFPDAGGTFGLRYRANGDLLAAKPGGSGAIRRVNDGTVVVPNVAGVNGLYPDADGNIWFTDFSSVRRLNADDSIDDIVTGANSSSANGVLLDADRGLVFYTDYGNGLLRSVEIGADGSPGTVDPMVASIPGARLDGLSMDACGNIYVVDQFESSALYRVFLDETGAAIGDPEELVSSFPSNVANAIFGAGEGWDEMSMYAAGQPGDVYRVEVGVSGADYTYP